MSRPHFDEMHDGRQQVRPHYQSYQRWLAQQADQAMQARREEAEMIFRRVGITFAVYGAKDEEGAGTFDVAGAGETGIGHEKNGGPANLTHASGQFKQRPGTKDELGCGAGGERADHGIGIGNREIGHQESKI